MKKQLKLALGVLCTGLIVGSTLMAKNVVKPAMRKTTVIRDITKKELVALLKTDKNLVIKFYMPGCGPCKYISPIIESVAASADTIEFVSVDASTDPDWYIDTFEFATVPTVVYYKGGQEIKKYRHGSNDKTITKKDIEDIITQVYGADSIKKI